MDTKYLTVIKAPIITEKTQDLLQNENKVTFSVDIKANKTEIKLAVEKIFDVKVEQVNVINVKPKKKRVGRYEGATSKVKKAIVKLSEDSKIDIN